jgi:hypothetical protein
MNDRLASANVVANRPGAGIAHWLSLFHKAAIRRNWNPVHPSHLGPAAQVRIRRVMPGFRPKSSASTSHPVPKAVVG